MQSADPKILEILGSEQLEPSEYVRTMCDKIINRHKDRVQALVYYGSSLRAMNDPDKMLDFYVLVDSYRKTHSSMIRAFLNLTFPPCVYYMENENPDGTISTCKYSVISLSEFEKRGSKKAFFSIVWGRFSQPCVLLYPKNENVRLRVQQTRASAIKHVAAQTSPLFPGKVNAVKFWARGFMESYKTELRPESSTTRSEEIVSRYADRYEKLMEILYGSQDADGNYQMPPASKLQVYLCKWRWFWRRVLGKPYAGIRVLNSAFTFDGGLDYVLRKLKNHSGQTIDVSDGQRRHPILWSPVLAWKLYRKGAFK